MRARVAERRWAAIAVVMGSVLLLGASAWGLRTFAGHDRVELLDGPEVPERAESACRELHQRLDALPAGGGQNAVAQERAARIVSENAEVERFVDEVRALGHRALEDDGPAEAWLGDWGVLVELRSRYAERLLAEPDPLAPAAPQDEGVPITDRTEDVGIDCTVLRFILDDLSSIPQAPSPAVTTTWRREVDGVGFVWRLPREERRFRSDSAVGAINGGSLPTPCP